MADYNKNYMAAYKQYGESMIAGGGGTNLSGTGSSTMQVWNYGNDDQPSGLGAPTAKPKEEKKSESFWDRITNLFTSNDVDVTSVYTPSVNPASVYDSDAFNPAQVEDYVYRADMSEQTQDMVEQAMGYEKTKLGQLQLLDTRAMTEEEKKRLGPLLDLADDIRNENIKTTELPPIEGEQQSSLMDALMEGQPTAGLMSRPSVFTGQEVQIASTLPDWMEALPLEGFSQALIDIREGRIDRETGQPIVQEEEEVIDVSPAAEAPDQQGLMSRPSFTEAQPEDSMLGGVFDFIPDAFQVSNYLTGGNQLDGTKDEENEADLRMKVLAEIGKETERLDGKDGTIATKEYKLDKEQLESQAVELYPDTPLAAAALVATINAESAGGKDMTENGYSKAQAVNRFVNPYKRKDGTLGPKMKARKEAILASESPEEIFEVVYGSGYTGNSNLGNREVGDGFRFIGRGPIMLTGRRNYEKYGKKVGVDLVNNPELMATDQEVSLAVTKAYLEDKGLKYVKSAKDLYKVIGHSGGMKEANKRWKEAKKLENKFRRRTSPRPMLRPE